MTVCVITDGADEKTVHFHDQAALRRAAARGAQLPDKGGAHPAAGDGFPDMDNVLPDKIEPTENPFYRYDHQCQPPDGYSGVSM